MTAATPYPYIRIALVALVASALGVASVLARLRMEGLLDFYWMPAMVSVLLWLVLGKQLRARPLWAGAIVGLLSPVIACLALAPIGIGLAWAVVLASVWYFTLPIALATGLVMHRIVNPPRGI